MSNSNYNISIPYQAYFWVGMLLMILVSHYASTRHTLAQGLAWLLVAAPFGLTVWFGRLERKHNQQVTRRKLIGFFVFMEFACISASFPIGAASLSNLLFVILIGPNLFAMALSIWYGSLKEGKEQISAILYLLLILELLATVFLGVCFGICNRDGHFFEMGR